MNKIIIDLFKNKENHAWSKARDDINEILKTENYKVLFIPTGRKRIVKKILSILYIYIKTLLLGDVVLIQYPTSRLISGAFLRLLKCRKILFINDIISLRSNEKELSIKNEIDYFNHFDVVISHNKIMTKWLIENGLIKNVVNLNITHSNHQ